MLILTYDLWLGSGAKGHSSTWFVLYRSTWSSASIDRAWFFFVGSHMVISKASFGLLINFMFNIHEAFTVVNVDSSYSERNCTCASHISLGFVMWLIDGTGPKCSLLSPVFCFFFPHRAVAVVPSPRSHHRGATMWDTEHPALNRPLLSRLQRYQDRVSCFFFPFFF